MQASGRVEYEESHVLKDSLGWHGQLRLWCIGGHRGGNSTSFFPSSKPPFPGLSGGAGMGKQKHPYAYPSGKGIAAFRSLSSVLHYLRIWEDAKVPGDDLPPPNHHDDGDDYSTVAVAVAVLITALEELMPPVPRPAFGFDTVHGTQEAQNKPNSRSILSRAWVSNIDASEAIWYRNLAGRRSSGEHYSW
ncbi:hypothetical protein B7494_g1020 [Chlorociboria aeruginascens]|nr:hypothetical protein B7494_g1020 [Chlorociboria aeruginascens]